MKEAQEFSVELGDAEQYATCLNSPVVYKLAYSTFFKKFFKKKSGISKHFVSLSLGLFRKDAAALPSQTWAGLRVRPPGFQGVHSHGAQGHSAAGHLSHTPVNCNAFQVVNRQFLSAVVVHSPVVWCASPGGHGLSS